MPITKFPLTLLFGRAESRAGSQLCSKHPSPWESTVTTEITPTWIVPQNPLPLTGESSEATFIFQVDIA